MSCRKSAGPAYLEQTGTNSKAPTATDPQHAMPSQQVPLTHKPVVKAALHLLTQLRPHIARLYLNSEDCDRFNITCGQPLNLEWESSNGGDFLRLVTLEKMQQFAGEYAFDSIRELPRDPAHPSRNSEFVATHLYSHFFSVYQHGFLADQSRWYYRHPSDWEANKLRYFRPDEEVWMVDYILGVKDSDLPHINCTVTQVDKLQNDTLMLSEVWCVLMLTLVFFQCHQDSKCEVVPVTVITISGTTFRLVQGVIDGSKTSVNIRKSRVMTIGEEREDMKNKMMLMVRWLLAEPIWPSEQ